MVALVYKGKHASNRAIAVEESKIPMCHREEKQK